MIFAVSNQQKEFSRRLKTFSSVILKKREEMENDHFFSSIEVFNIFFFFLETKESWLQVHTESTSYKVIFKSYKEESVSIILDLLDHLILTHSLPTILSAMPLNWNYSSSKSGVDRPAKTLEPAADTG